MLRSALLIPAAIATFALTGCALDDDGARVTQNRDVDTFTRIDNQRLRQGPPARR